MKILIRTTLAAVLGITGCGTPHPNREFSDPLAKFKTVPLDVIYALPERIARLPVTRSMRQEEFFGALKLSKYRGNSTGSIRHSAFVLKLDEEHALEVQLDPHSFRAITHEQIDAVLSGKTLPKVAPTVSEVIGCTLWRNGSESVAHRRLAMKETE